MADESTAAGPDEVVDAQLDRGARALTPERIEQVVNQCLDDETGARLQVYLDTCAHCGLCADACHYYLSNDNDPRFSPVGKVQQTLLHLVKKRGKVSPAFIKKAAEIAYTECNVCKRCTMYCPFGIDTAYLILVVRRICHNLGVTPQYLQDTAHSHSATLNQMWIKEDEWLDTLQWQESEARDELDGLRIPLEKEGADVMYSVIAPEPKFQPQLILQMAVLMNLAGVDWTMPATPGWDNSDMAMYSGDNEVMGRVKRAHFDTAARLKVKRVVMGECGHAFRSVYDVGNRFLGFRMPPVTIVHALEFYHELFTTGKLTVTHKYDKTVTLHDPCNVSRGRGLHDMARHVVNAACADFVDMIPNREHNFCCTAGGGVINCGPPFKQKRMEASRIKAEQLKATGAKVVISPCHNCHSGLEDIVEHYELDMEVKFLGDILFEVVDRPAVAGNTSEAG